MNNKMKKKPPLIAQWLLKLMTSKTDEPSLLGDIEEDYIDIFIEKGRMRSWCWYWLQVFISVPSFIKYQIYWRVYMLIIYLKIAIRYIKNHKGYSFINIFGLATGMGCCILLLLWVQDELSFDRFHHDAGQIYRIYRKDSISKESKPWAFTPGPLAKALKLDFPEIIESVRIRPSFYFKFSKKNLHFYEGNGFFVGPSFFEMFSFDFLDGSKENALSGVNNIVISESMADKYFGKEHPIGQIISIEDKYDMKVTGVFRNIPHNSSLQFDFLIPMDFTKRWFAIDEWGSNDFYTFVKLQNINSFDEVSLKLLDYLKKINTGSEDKLYLQNLTRIHLYSDFEYDNFKTGELKYLAIFTVVALFILIIACINFINLSTARSGKRSKEVAIRKVAGAFRNNIAKQFFVESILYVFVSFICAIILVSVLLPRLNSISGKMLSFSLLNNPILLVGLSGILVVTVLLAGSYPSMILSSFQPVRILKGGWESGAKGSWFRQILVVVQFSISFILIISTLIVARQLNYMMHKNLGFEKEYLIYTGMAPAVKQQYESLRTELLQNPYVLNVTASSNTPHHGYAFSTEKVSWRSKNPEIPVLFRGTSVDYGFFDTYKMEMVEGRQFLRTFSTDTLAFIVNEKAVEVMGLESPVGEQLSCFGKDGTIVGVVKNYHFRSLHNEIEPLVIQMIPAYFVFLYIRIAPGHTTEIIQYLKKMWTTRFPSRPFEYHFVDDELEKMYHTEQKMQSLFQYFTFFGIVIACLGLFGLAAFIAEQRTKEIGIRKILGASSTTILFLLSRSFLKWVLLANFFAWPCAYYGIKKMMINYPYRADITIWIFFLAGIIGFGISGLTVGFHAWRAATANPVDSLKYE